MEYAVKIDSFEGPLDLLLHLIKESKMDILNIKIEEITNQYLKYINEMSNLNLNVASEYLVMASELIEMKSKLLLPRHEEEYNEEDEIDPNVSLMERLIEYQKYKEITKSFKELESIRQEIFTKQPEQLSEYANNETVINSDVTLDDLVNAFQKFLDRQKLEQPLNTKITAKEITVEDRRKEIKTILKTKRKVNFFELFDIITKEYIVLTFLAILEMSRKDELVIIQENNFDDIYCEVR